MGGALIRVVPLLGIIRYVCHGSSINKGAVCQTWQFSWVLAKILMDLRYKIRVEFIPSNIMELHDMSVYKAR